MIVCLLGAFQFAARIGETLEGTREAFFWFPSTQGRQNGRAGGRQKENVKP